MVWYFYLFRNARPNDLYLSSISNDLFFYLCLERTFGLNSFGRFLENGENREFSCFLLYVSVTFLSLTLNK